MPPLKLEVGAENKSRSRNRDRELRFGSSWHRDDIAWQGLRIAAPDVGIIFKRFGLPLAFDV
jgi:hypothetical protein